MEMLLVSLSPYIETTSHLCRLEEVQCDTYQDWPFILTTRTPPKLEVPYKYFMVVKQFEITATCVL